VTRPLTVVQVLPALDAGGVERSTLEIAAALVAAGHRAVVVSGGGRLEAALQSHGAVHVTLPIGRKSPFTFRHAARLRSILREHGADMQARPHLVTTVHGLNSPGRYSQVMLRGERVICVSQTVHDFVLEHYPQTDRGRLVVIPRGIDPAAFAHRAETERDQSRRAAFIATHPQLAGGPLLLMPARGTRLKGHAHALGLLARLRAGGLDARLLLAGVVQAGRERYLRELAAQAATLGVGEAVAFAEPMANMRELYAWSDLVLQLSDKPEAFGRTVVESLCSGRPVLGWNHGGVGELLRELFPQGAVARGDADALEVHARELLAAPRPAIRLPDRYTLARMQAETLALYDQLVRSA
jgi:glycosyltransferase involved in cell wall biosynthesis